MKRSGKARRFERSASSAALWLGGVGICVGLAGCGEFNGRDDGALCVVVENAGVGANLNDAATSFPLATPGSEAGERRSFVVDGVEFAFRWAPPGRFAQGSPADEAGRDEYEARREVELTRGFWILETETTQEMWSVVCGENPSRFRGARRPVDSVGLAEIAEFFAALSERFGGRAAAKIDATVKTGKVGETAKVGEPREVGETAKTGETGEGGGTAKVGETGEGGVRFALPTEAQWEYAARAGSTGPYPAATLEEIAWFGDENDGGTRDVATKKPNAWGLYDVCGNLWEWCADRFAEYPLDENGRGLPAVDPTGATPEECPGNIRVDRGGCWDSEARECRTAYRGFYDADRKGPYVGFRFVCVPEIPSDAER